MAEAKESERLIVWPFHLLHLLRLRIAIVCTRRYTFHGHSLEFDALTARRAILSTQVGISIALLSGFPEQPQRQLPSTCPQAEDGYCILILKEVL